MPLVPDIFKLHPDKSLWLSRKWEAQMCCLFATECLTNRRKWIWTISRGTGGLKCAVMTRQKWKYSYKVLNINFIVPSPDRNNTVGEKTIYSPGAETELFWGNYTIPWPLTFFILASLCHQQHWLWLTILHRMQEPTEALTLMVVKLPLK